MKFFVEMQLEGVEKEWMREATVRSFAVLESTQIKLQPHTDELSKAPYAPAPPKPARRASDIFAEEEVVPLPSELSVADLICKTTDLPKAAQVLVATVMEVLNTPPFDKLAHNPVTLGFLLATYTQQPSLCAFYTHKLQQVDVYAAAVKAVLHGIEEGPQIG